MTIKFENALEGVKPAVGLQGKYDIPNEYTKRVQDLENALGRELNEKEIATLREQFKVERDREAYRDKQRAYIDIGRFKGEDGRIKPALIADYLLKDHNFVTAEDNKEMFYYDAGVYVQGANAIIDAKTKELLRQEYTAHRVNEIAANIAALTYAPREKMGRDAETVVVENGILNIKTLELTNHDPEIIALGKLPIVYDPDAECPECMKFFESTIDKEDIPTIQEWFGFQLMPIYSHRAALMCFGPGRNGKTVFLNVLEAFLGEGNHVGMSIRTFTRSAFARGVLFGKMGNIVDDLSDSELYDTTEFKKATGRGTLDADVKFHGRFFFKNGAKMSFSANSLPATRDTSQAFFDRWIIIKFSKVFAAGDADPELLEKLTTPEELSGLLNWALEGLKRLNKQKRFTHSKTTEETKKEWMANSVPLCAYAEEYLTYSPDETHSKSEIYAELAKWCKVHDSKVPTMASVSKELPRWVPGISDKRVSQGMMWVNLGYKEGKNPKEKEKEKKEGFVMEERYIGM